MIYNEFEIAISSPRLTKYRVACAGNTRKAQKLYRANIRLSQKIYAVIGLFEVVLRNSIDGHFVPLKGSDWLANAVCEPTGYLNGVGCEDSFHSVYDAIHKLGLKYTHDGLVASLTFGFWTYQFSKHEFPASGNTLLSVFPHLPFGTKQKDVFQLLMKVNILRNRIAHHEPICFDSVTGAISTAMVSKRYTVVTDLLSWLGYNHQKLFFGIDGVKSEINFINSL